MLIHALPILIHWVGFRLSAPYLNTCITYLNTLSRLVPDSSRQQPRLHIFPDSATKTTLGKTEHYVNRVVSQSESSITSPESSANQNRALRHPRALGSGWRPFSALGSSRLAIAYLKTLGSSPPCADQLTLLLLARLLKMRSMFQ